MEQLLYAVFAAGGAFMAVRIELRWLRRDVDELRDRVKHCCTLKAAKG